MSKIQYTAPDSATLVSDEGVLQGAAYKFNFTGTGVTVTVVNGVATVTIPGGALTAMPVADTVFVDTIYGSNVTGLPERLDKPFATIAAARASAATLIPSPTKRIKIVVQSGTYLEQIVLDPYVDYDLGNSIIDLQAGALYTIDDLGVAIDSIIYGNAQINRSTAGTLGCIRTQNAASILKVYCDQINLNVGTGTAIECTDGTQTITANHILLGTNSKAISISAGNQTIFCPKIDSPANEITVECLGGTQIIHGDILNAYGLPSTFDCVTCTTGTQTIYGNITCDFNIAARCVSGLQTIYGNISGGAGITGLIHCDGGTQNIYGDCTGTISIGVIVCTGGVQTINDSRITATANTDAVTQTAGSCIIKDCILIASGTGFDIATGSTVLLYGTNQTPIIVASVHTENVGIMIRDVNVI